ncbi:MAG TPA: hypothetical protein VMF88_15515 [Bacteroidota bacterium]|nr:hypothetical protein [Bacteroidota bacterium]
MSSILIQLCPLCGKPSEAVVIDPSRRKLIKCKTCSEFAITREAEKHPRLSYSDIHKELSLTAKNISKNRILNISVERKALIVNDVLRSSLVDNTG